MLGRILKATLTALSAVIAVKIADYLTKNVPQFGAITIILIAAGAATIFNVCSDELIAFAKRRVQWFRKQLDPRSRFEGVWIKKVLEFPERPYAYFTISYNADADAYLYRGCAFNEQGKLKATWVCPKIDFDLKKDEVRFVTEGQVIDVNAKGEISRAVGHIQFEKNLFGRRLRYTRGTGFFVDFGTQSGKAHFIVDRIDKKTIASLIKKQEIVSNEDIAELIQAYIKMNKTDKLQLDTKEAAIKN